MTLPIAREFSEKGIRVVTIVAGPFSTKMLLGDLPENVQDFLAETMLFPHRLGEPSEYAQLVESIVDNPLINGTSIRLDGGFRSFSFS